MIRRQHCDSCGLDFSPTMLNWHLQNYHRVLRCRICGAPVTVYGLTLSNWPTRSDFCSKKCQEIARGRGLCAWCLKEPEESIEELCGGCQRVADAARAAIADVRSQLLAITRARFLPRRYRRAE